MRGFLLFLGIIILGFLASQYLPWWTLVILSAILVTALNPPKISAVLLASLLGGICLWGGYALWIDVANQHILSNRIGQLLGGLSGFWMIIVTALFGGILACLGAWVGRTARNVFIVD